MLNSSYGELERACRSRLSTENDSELLRGWLPPSQASIELISTGSDAEASLKDAGPIEARAAIASAFEAVRKAWEQLDAVFRAFFGPPLSQTLLLKPISLRHPFLFYLGHLPAFAWNRYQSLLQPQHSLVVSSSLTMDELLSFGKLFERGMDPDVDDPSQCHWHSQVPEAVEDWPSVSKVAAYRDYIRQDLFHRVQQWCYAPRSSSPPANECFTLLRTIAEHEWMHTETLLYMVHQLDALSKAPLQAQTHPWKRQSAADSSPNDCEQRGFMPLIGTFVSIETEENASLGKNPEEKSPHAFQFAWDNEMPQVQRTIPRRLLVQEYPVTNSQFLNFVKDGGYRDLHRYWLDESDRLWCAKNSRQCPQFWRAIHRPDRANDTLAFHVVHLDGRLSKHSIGDPACTENNWPVYISLAEARAYANWVCVNARHAQSREIGWRLPTEAEWQYIADGAYPKTSTGDGNSDSAMDGNHGFRHWGPIDTYQSPNSSRWNVRDLVGNGWEWTDTPFQPLDPDRFQPTPLYPEYSADFFDQKHFVLKGASWATGAPLIRPTFRNWYQAHYPYVFAKFRLVCDVSPVELSDRSAAVRNEAPCSHDASG
ncbi:hypothetical protein F1559_004444 [Cyanidiococcus yangmingshanensis]|uniref:Sulfatase-modifying factor enzyme-like domain-containing protein n=1 Tax=Cyanidiococcus yangmingshanensis TaxID=2690220 RepID=A0A7J7IN87_9RHOD|nr:hypothetical protein F1559_004444 [Cyanidiococcus yangmingshanensis]